MPRAVTDYQRPEQPEVHAQHLFPAICALWWRRQRIAVAPQTRPQRTRAVSHQ
jgi:hypothetical protein